MGLGMFVMHRALRLPAPESLWFLFISPEENRKEKKKQRPFLVFMRKLVGDPVPRIFIGAHHTGETGE